MFRWLTLQYASLKAKNDKLDSYTYQKTEEAFIEAFPACLDTTVTAPK